MRIFHDAPDSEKEKTKRISDIRKEGLEPIIRVIARGLTKSEALLVEKTLLWQSGKWTDNIATGCYADKFRPLNTIHKELSGFDYQNGFFYYNVGDGKHRNWENYVDFGFVSAGQGARWRDAMRGFNVGDLFAAYLKRRGFVGIGRVKTKAEMIRNVRIGNKPLLKISGLRCRNMSDNCDSDELSEYVCLVEWINHVARGQAKWRSKPKLYTTTHVRASLDGQPETVLFLESQFGINVRELIR